MVSHVRLYYSAPFSQLIAELDKKTPFKYDLTSGQYSKTGWRVNVRPDLI
jgi:hypothetical protein